MHKVNRFNGLFGNIEANSLQICHAQLRLMEARFVKLEKKSPEDAQALACLLYTSPSPRDATLSRMPSSA